MSRFPHPLAHLQQRAWNAKTAPERHRASFCVWEAAIKLLGFVSLVRLGELKRRKRDLSEQVQELACPTLRDWWNWSRAAIEELADSNDGHFLNLQHRLFEPLPPELKHAPHLCEALAGGEPAEPLTGAALVEAVLEHRTRTLRRPQESEQMRASEHDRLGFLLLAGSEEVWSGIDLLAGRELIYVADVRRRQGGSWLVERVDFTGSELRRVESLEFSQPDAGTMPSPRRFYLAHKQALPSLPLHPLLRFDPDTGEVFFAQAPAEGSRVEHLCYGSGNLVSFDDTPEALRALLSDVLGHKIDSASFESWAARSRTREGVVREPGADTGQQRIGDFEILSKIGQGGMGVVYRAWQPSLARQVALKVLLSPGDPKAEARFAREIRSLGRVEHPHLVKVYSSGKIDDQWYYAMEVVEGADLGKILENLKPDTTRAVDETAWREAVRAAFVSTREQEQPISADVARAPLAPEVSGGEPVAAPRRRRLAARAHVHQAVEIVRQIAEAAHVLHEAGVIHRDIKPGNIMLSGDGTDAILMDLGLAQLADDAEGRLTRTAQFLGTLLYASPEQMNASASLDRRSDVYSLGVTLWELLTLRRPFDTDTNAPVGNLMVKVLEAKHPLVRKFNPKIPSDLEAIVMKCVAKSPSRRYTTAEALAEDLKRWQRGEPVQAQPPTLRYLAGKYVSRHRLGIATAAALFLAAVVGIVYAFTRVDMEREAARRAQAIAEGHLATERKLKEEMAAAHDARETALRGLERQRDEKVKALEAMERQRDQKQIALLAARRERDAKEKARKDVEESLVRSKGLRLLAEASVLSSSDPTLSLLLGVEGAELYPGYIANSALLAALNGGPETKTLQGHKGTVLGVRFSADGKRVLSWGVDRTVRVWDIESGGQLARAKLSGRAEITMFSPDGTRVVSWRNGPGRIWEAGTGRPIAPLENILWPPRSAKWGPKGERLLAVGDEGAFLYDGLTGARIAKMEGRDARAAMSLDGKLVATIHNGMTPRIWDARDGTLLRAMPRLGSEQQPFELSGVVLRFTRDGHRLISTVPVRTRWRAPEAVHLFIDSVATGERLFSAAAKRILAVHPDATWYLKDESDAPPTIVEVATQKETPLYGLGAVVRCYPAPSYQRVALLHTDDRVTIWDLVERRRVAAVEADSGHLEPRFSADGRWLVTGVPGDRTAVHVFSAVTGKKRRTLRHGDGPVTVGLSDDGRWAATGSPDGHVRLWDLEGASAITAPDGAPNRFDPAAFSPDGAWLVTGEGRIRPSVWDTTTGELAFTLETPPLVDVRGNKLWRTLRSASFSPDGSLIATVVGDEDVVLFDVVKKTVRHRLKPQGEFRGPLAFSAEGRRLLTVFGGVEIWDLGGGKRIAQLRGRRMRLETARFSPDGGQILTTSRKGVGIWDARSGKIVHTASVRSPEAEHAVYNRDGSRVLVWGRWGRPHVLDGRTGRVLRSINEYLNDIRDAAISPDGRSVLFARGNAVGLFSADTGKPIGRLDGHADTVEQIVFASGGKIVVTLVDDGTARVWDVASQRPRRDLKLGDSGLDEIAVSADGRSLAALDRSEREVGIWDLATGTRRATVRHEGRIFSARFDPDGKRIVTASQDRTAKVWDAVTGALLADLDEHRRSVVSARFDATGSRVVTGGTDQTARIWNAATGDRLRVLRGHPGPLADAVFSPDGSQILTLTREWNVTVWDASSGVRTLELEAPASGIARGVFDRDGDRIVTTADDSHASVWDGRTGAHLFDLLDHRETVTTAEFSPDGTKIVTASEDNTARIWSAADGTRLVKLEGHTGDLHYALFDPAGTRVATTSMDGTARLWDARTGEERALLRHRGPVYSAQFSRDGTKLLTASADRSARLWDTETGRELATLPHAKPLHSAIFDPTERRILTSLDDETCRIWPVDPLPLAIGRKPRELTDRERQRFGLETEQYRAAKKKVDSLFNTHILPDEVLQELAQDKTLSKRARAHALYLVSVRPPRTAWELHDRAWELIADKNNKGYHRWAKKYAEAARRLRPEVVEMKVVLAAAESRLGNSRACLTLLEEVAEEKGVPLRSRVLAAAFEALTHFGDGDPARGREAYDRMTRLRFLANSDETVVNYEDSMTDLLEQVSAVFEPR